MTVLTTALCLWNPPNGAKIYAAGALREAGHLSYGDAVDLNQENIRGFDVREFYVGLAADLKLCGY